VAFGRLAPAAIAGLLAWLPLERAVALLQADVRCQLDLVGIVRFVFTAKACCSADRSQRAIAK
jgi:hypothetical protein